MGMMPNPVTGAAGVAFISGKANFSIPNPLVIAHEIGHNLSLQHAPCGPVDGPDPSFPYHDGSVGTWGYDFRDGGALVHASTPDLMSYCGPQWISDYNFTNSLRYRLFNEGVPAATATAATQSLLLWGGIGADTIPVLEPAFVVNAAARTPRLRRRIPGSRTHLRWWPTLLPQLHIARGGRWRRQFQLCLRPAGAIRMGRESGENHPNRP